MTDLTSMTIAEARAGLASKSFTSLELTDAHLSAIEAARVLNAYILETPDQARAMARAVDAKIAKGEGGPLAGIPLGIKDLFATKDVRTTACSKILGNFVPPYQSTVTSQLWRDGAVMLGKLNNDEFAMGRRTRPRAGPVTNPWRREGSNTTLVPGGSSGGSASAVAALLCMGATATDTGGSIRQPAAFTATVGVKPTYGRCSRWGIVAFASSLDQAGPIARTTRDAAILMRSMAGHDPKDTTSVDRAVPDYEAAIGKSVKGMKIGNPKEYLHVDRRVDQHHVLEPRQALRLDRLERRPRVVRAPQERQRQDHDPEHERHVARVEDRAEREPEGRAGDDHTKRLLGSSTSESEMVASASRSSWKRPSHRGRGREHVAVADDEPLRHPFGREPDRAGGAERLVLDRVAKLTSPKRPRRRGRELPVERVRAGTPVDSTTSSTP